MPRDIVARELNSLRAESKVDSRTESVSKDVKYW